MPSCLAPGAGRNPLKRRCRKTPPGGSPGRGTRAPFLQHNVCRGERGAFNTYLLFLPACLCPTRMRPHVLPPWTVLPTRSPFESVNLDNRFFQSLGRYSIQQFSLSPLSDLRVNCRHVTLHPQTLQHLSPKSKDVLPRNHSAVFKFRKFNIHTVCI